MKATIDEEGLMEIRAETPLEGYALRKWHDENGERLQTENMILIFNPERAEPET